jgi:GNAT superfamily N-acetyltransferase
MIESFRRSRDKLMNLRISTDLSEFDVGMIHRFLAEDSYWARGIERSLLERALAQSLCFGGFVAQDQVAFARVVTDRATVAHLKDVFVLAPHRGRGYGVALMQAVMAHPDLRTATMTLATADAHGLYTRFGFVAESQTERLMIRPGRFLPPVAEGTGL